MSLLIKTFQTGVELQKMRWICVPDIDIDVPAYGTRHLSIPYFSNFHWDFTANIAFVKKIIQI
jgi:hypothetical protein